MQKDPWFGGKKNQTSFHLTEILAFLYCLRFINDRPDSSFFFLDIERVQNIFCGLQRRKKKLKLIGSKFRKTLIDFVHLLGRVRRIDWNFLTEFIESARLLRYVYNYSLLLSFTFPTFTQF